MTNDKSDWIEMPDFEFFKKDKESPKKHSSFLLGAGFSVNQGYPMARDLNCQIQNVNPDNLTIDGEGNLYKIPESKEDPFWYFSDARKKYFIKELINLFLKENTTFDYEEFYDFIKTPNLNSRDDFKKICEDFRKKYNIQIEEQKIEYNNRELVNNVERLMNQLIQITLVDKNGKNFYEPSVHLMKPLPSEYTGFLDILESVSKDSIVHIHTLNHDLFFETFNHTDYISGELSDGFEELGSKFYGRIEDNRMIRLKRFTNQYDKRFNLYKLHGSLDQFQFRHQDGSKTEYIKVRKGVGLSNLYKEIEDNGNYKYENDFTNYYADFLSGTTYKITRYKDGYYKEVFEHFVNNLVKSDQLIIVGYGCRDSKINELILENFDFKNKKVVIIDPYPSKDVITFGKKINANIIEKKPDEAMQEVMEG